MFCAVCQWLMQFYVINDSNTACLYSQWNRIVFYNKSLGEVAAVV